MSPLALCLVLAAAQLHASWNLVAKKAGGGNHFVLLGALLVTVLWAPAAVWVGVDAVARLGAREWAVLGLSPCCTCCTFVAFCMATACPT